MCDTIQNKTLSIEYGTISMYFIRTAVKLIKEYQSKGVHIVGLEAFHLNGLGIQPSIEHSLDIPADSNCWETAISFLTEGTHNDYVYEIWYRQ